MEVERLSIDEELGAGDVHGTDADWLRVPVFREVTIHLCRHCDLNSTEATGNGKLALV